MSKLSNACAALRAAYDALPHGAKSFTLAQWKGWTGMDPENNGSASKLFNITTEAIDDVDARRDGRFLPNTTHLARISHRRDLDAIQPKAYTYRKRKKGRKTRGSRMADIAQRVAKSVARQDRELLLPKVAGSVLSYDQPEVKAEIKVGAVATPAEAAHVTDMVREIVRSHSAPNSYARRIADLEERYEELLDVCIKLKLRVLEGEERMRNATKYLSGEVLK